MGYIVHLFGSKMHVHHAVRIVDILIFRVKITGYYLSQVSDIR